MDSAQIQNTLKLLCKVMWDNNVTNPITYVTQISYLLFLKMLEEMDAEQKAAGNGNHRSLFGKIKVDGEELDFDALRWSRLTSDPDNERMLRTMRDTLPLLAQHPKLSQGARSVFRNASVVIPTGAALRPIPTKRTVPVLNRLALPSATAFFVKCLSDFEILRLLPKSDGQTKRTSPSKYLICLVGGVWRVRLKHTIGQHYHGLKTEFLEQTFLYRDVARGVAKENAVGKNNPCPPGSKLRRTWARKSTYLSPFSIRSDRLASPREPEKGGFSRM